MEIRIADDKECLDEIVNIHLSTFRGFFLTFLGKDFLKILYEGFIIHKDSNVIIAIEDEKIVGFLAYSSDMSGFYKFLIKRKLLLFFLYAFKAFIKKPSILPRLLSAFGKSDEVKRDEKYIELSSIGVSLDFKGRGVGTKLIDFLKSHIDFTIFKYISLETDTIDNVSTNKFYIKNGFFLYKTYETNFGRKMNEYNYRSVAYEEQNNLVN